MNSSNITGDLELEGPTSDTSEQGCELPPSESSDVAEAVESDLRSQSNEPNLYELLTSQIDSDVTELDAYMADVWSSTHPPPTGHCTQDDLDACSTASGTNESSVNESADWDTVSFLVCCGY